MRDRAWQLKGQIAKGGKSQLWSVMPWPLPLTTLTMYASPVCLHPHCASLICLSSPRKHRTPVPLRLPVNVCKRTRPPTRVKRTQRGWVRKLESTLKQNHEIRETADLKRKDLCQTAYKWCQTKPAAQSPDLSVHINPSSLVLQGLLRKWRVPSFSKESARHSLMTTSCERTDSWR